MNLELKSIEISGITAVIFDLDGVIVDTAKYHYRAWKRIADDENIYFDETINERLKGVSRLESLKIILERGERTYSTSEAELLADRKNHIYVSLLQNLSPADILPCVGEFIESIRAEHIKTAICSASKNTDFILGRLGIGDKFDAVVTGNDVTRSKPCPDGFLLAAGRLGVKPSDCLVIEDAAAGIDAAVSAGMKSVGIGDERVLHRATCVFPSTEYLCLDMMS